MKPVQDIYSDATRALVEAFNSKLQAVETERRTIDQERAAVAADALAGEIPASKLVKQLEALRVRAIQADIDELVARRDLPAIDAASRKDWAAERDRRRATVEKRVAELNKHADELGMERAVRHNVVLTDPVRRDNEDAARTASEHASKGSATPADVARVETLKAEIVKALSR